MVTLARRALLGLASACTIVGIPAAQQTSDGLRRLFSAAVLQERASGITASRDTRPEVKAFAAEMAEWRRGQIERLRGLLRERSIAEPVLVPEHEAAWEGLETLDYLALSRRYAEMQVGILEWEIAAYEGASRSGDAALVGYASEILPELRRLLVGARRASEAAAP